MIRNIALRTLILTRDKAQPTAWSCPRRNHNSSNGGSIPANIIEHEDTQKMQNLGDRSREVSGQQTSQHFSSGFMSDRQSRSSEYSIMDANSDGFDNQTCQDMGGNAHLESVLQTNVPEPYSPGDETNLKEGIPEGLSDCPRSRDQRWTMEDRMENRTFVDK